MRQFILGCIRQLTTRKETNAQRLARAARSTEPFVGEQITKGQTEGGGRRLAVQGTETGRIPNRLARQKQLNISIQSAAADIVTRLITADIILSQRAEHVEEIVREMLWRAFDGAERATEGWERMADTTDRHGIHVELRLRSIHCRKCPLDISVDWLS